MDYKSPIKVFDFFSGCGGTSQGFKQAGMEIMFALDNDSDSENTFRTNFPEVHFENADINEFMPESLSRLINSCEGHPILFSGCAPCQPFTKQKTTHPRDDIRVGLLNEFQRFVVYYLPEYIFVENVPGIQTPQLNGPLGEFLKTIETLNYQFDVRPLHSQSYGVPQRRRRLVLIASRLGKIEIPPSTHGRDARIPRYSTVREWIYDLPPLMAGEEHSEIPNHRAASLSPKNIQRIMATPPGGGRLDWPEELRLECHNGYDGHTDVYGRMNWNQPATGLTTRCISLSNGRFGHPEQHRAISVREAACLQTFPRDFIFSGSLNSMAKQIGNAVPVMLAQKFGEHFIDHFNHYLEGQKHGKI